MSANQVRDLFSRLSLSQGFYGRLLREIENSEDPEAIYEAIGDGCSFDLDVIFKVEC